MSARSSLYFLYFTLLFFPICLFMTACDGNSRAEKKTKEVSLMEKPYQIDGTYLGEKPEGEIVVYTDNHRTLLVDHIKMEEGKFTLSGKTPDVNKITIVTPSDKRYILYAQGDQKSELKIDAEGKMTFSPSDTLNYWLQEQSILLDTLPQEQQQPILDSLCRSHRHSFRSALLIYRQIPHIEDSLFIRRCLGHLSTEVKPLWYMDELNRRMDNESLLHNKTIRLKSFTFASRDTSVLAVNTQKPDSRILYFWAEYNPESVQRLRSLDTLAQKYGLYKYEKDFAQKKKKVKRLEIITFCLQASDSAAWLKTVKEIPGQHVFLPDGWNHPAITAWKIDRLPSLLLIDRYSQVQGREIYFKALQDRIDKLPEKTLPPNLKKVTAKDKNNVAVTDMSKKRVIK